MDQKNPISSKINWLSLIGIAIAAAPQVSVAAQQILPPELALKACAAINVGVIIARTFFTTTGISFGAPIRN